MDGKKLAALRESRFFSRAELGRRSELAVTAIQRIEQAGMTTVRLGTMRQLATGFDIPPEKLAELIGQDIPAGITADHDWSDPIPTWDIDVRANAWAAIPICELRYDDDEERKVIESGRFRLRVLGDCMAPSYPDGAIVEFQIVRADKPLELNGDYCVCRSDNTASTTELRSPLALSP